MSEWVCTLLLILFVYTKFSVLSNAGVIHIKPCKHAISYNSVLQDTIISTRNHQIKCV